MFSRFSRSLFVALLFSLLFVVQASAGGWAVITLDELPSNVVAGAPLKVGFTVLQHGRTPMEGLYPTVTANLQSDKFVVNAEPEGEPGHYTATLSFPTEGEWQWSIQAFSMDQAMPVLSVAPATGATVNQTNAPDTRSEPALSVVSPMMWMSVLALAVGLVGALIAFRSRNRQVAGLTAISLLAGVSLLIAGSVRTSAAEAQTNSAPDTLAASTVSQVEHGRQLFIAKGCITCHYNSKAASASEYWTIEMGAPNLSNYSANPEVIFMRLKDPASVKSDTQMPQLNLKKWEIEALVAFINSDPD